jgi:protein-disulfide isomerase
MAEEKKTTNFTTIFINGKMLVGSQPFASFKSLIDLELSK